MSTQGKSPLLWKNYLRPQKFLSVAQSWAPRLLCSGILVFLFGIIWGLFLAPTDAQQGEGYRILYLHAPCAWLALGLYAAMGGASGAALIWKHPLSYTVTLALAPVGTLFAALCLITGSLWGQPMWGTWWVWDARLTSMFILFMLYVGALWLRIDLHTYRLREASGLFYLNLMGLLNLPVIKFSVEWWTTLHQPASLLRLNGPAIATEILIPLLISAVGLMLIATGFVLLLVRGEIYKLKFQNLQRVAPFHGKESL